MPIVLDYAAPAAILQAAQNAGNLRQRNWQAEFNAQQANRGGGGQSTEINAESLPGDPDYTDPYGRRTSNPQSTSGNGSPMPSQGAQFFANSAFEGGGKKDDALFDYTIPGSAGGSPRSTHAVIGPDGKKVYINDALKYGQQSSALGPDGKPVGESDFLKSGGDVAGSQQAVMPDLGGGGGSGTFKVTKAQKVQLDNIDANASYSDDEKQYERNRVLGMQNVETFYDADGNPHVLTPEQAVKAGVSGQKELDSKMRLDLAKARSDTAAANAKNTADYHGQLIDLQIQGLELKRKTEMDRVKGVDSQTDRANQKALFENEDKLQSAKEKVAAQVVTEALQAVKNYQVDKGRKMPVDDPELMRLQQQTQLAIEAETKIAQQGVEGKAQRDALLRSQQSGSPTASRPAPSAAQVAPAKKTVYFSGTPFTDNGDGTVTSPDGGVYQFTDGKIVRKLK